MITKAASSGCSPRYALWLPTMALIAATLVGTVLAGPLADAQVAYKRGDYMTAFRLLQPLAIGGNSVAQNNLGAMYHKGYGVPQDYAEAVKWYRKAMLVSHASTVPGTISSAGPTE